MGNRMNAPFALMPCEPISIDDYSILVWIPKICTKRIGSSESVLLLILLLRLLSDREAIIRIDYLAHLLLVLALASVFISCASLPWARAVVLSVLLLCLLLLTLTIAARTV